MMNSRDRCVKMMVGDGWRQETFCFFHIVIPLRFRNWVSNFYSKFPMMGSLDASIYKIFKQLNVLNQCFVSYVSENCVL